MHACMHACMYACMCSCPRTCPLARQRSKSPDSGTARYMLSLPCQDRACRLPVLSHVGFISTCRQHLFWQLCFPSERFAVSPCLCAALFFPPPFKRLILPSSVWRGPVTPWRRLARACMHIYVCIYHLQALRAAWACRCALLTVANCLGGVRAATRSRKNCGKFKR